MSNIIKIYGLRTSGSNWLQWLLEHNVEDVVVLRNQLAWKHGNPTNTIDWSGEIIHWDDKKTLGSEYPQVFQSWKNEKLVNGKSIIDMKDEVEAKFNSGNLINCFIVKHPYTWMDSRLNKRKKDLETELNDWNQRIKSYFEFDYPSKVIVSYEKLNQNPQSEIQKIANKFNLKMSESFKDTENNLTHGYSINGKRKTLNLDFENEFRLKFTKEQLLKIDSLLDNESLKLYNSL